jgi:hypothetical protein
MSVGVVENVGRVTSIAGESIRKTNDAAKVAGKAAVKLIEAAGKVAKSANSDSERGRIIDIRV